MLHNLQSEQPSASNLLNCSPCPLYTEQNIETKQIGTGIFFDLVGLEGDAFLV